MATTKNTAEFFPFKVKDGKTLFVLQRKYGLAGIGFFTQIMRWLSLSPGHYYQYVDEYDKDRLNQFCGVGESDTKAMIEDMVKTEKLDPELWRKYQVIFSQDFVDELAELYRKRSTKPLSREDVLERVSKDHSAPFRAGSAETRDFPATEDREESIGEYREESISSSAQSAPAGRKELSPMKDEVANLYQERLTQHQPHETWSNYAQERKALSNLAKKTRALADVTVFSGDPLSLADAVVQGYLAERSRSNNAYWARAPVTPAALLTRWDKITAIIAQEWAEHEAIHDAVARARSSA
jgi:hypothetical protein